MTISFRARLAEINRDIWTIFYSKETTKAGYLFLISLFFYLFYLFIIGIILSNHTALSNFDIGSAHRDLELSFQSFNKLS